MACFERRRFTAATSRRVVIAGLPEGISYHQLLKAVRGDGGLMTVNIINTFGLDGPGKCSSLVEFYRPQDAKAYVDFTNANALYFQDAHNQIHRANVYLIPTTSNTLSCTQLDQFARATKSTSMRCLVLTLFPKTSVWEFLEDVGLEHVISVHYVNFDGRLRIEFVSIFESSRALDMIRMGKTCYSLRNGRSFEYGNNATDVNVSELRYLEDYSEDLLGNGVLGKLIPFSYNDLSAEFNKSPYNGSKVGWTTPLTHLNNQGQDSTGKASPGNYQSYEDYAVLSNARRKEAQELGQPLWRVPAFAHLNSLAHSQIPEIEGVPRV